MSSKTTSWILELVDKISAPLRNAQGAADDVADSVERVEEELDNASNAGDRFNQFAVEFGAKAFLFSQAAEGIGKFNSYFQDAIKPGVELQTQMADLSAVTQKTGDDLNAIRERAQDLAVEFGGNATKHAESFKMVIAKFGPDIADSDEALGRMGENIAILSKSMGGDATKAADALTTAMQQYGIDLTDPIKASEEMARIMNLLVAGGNAGSSEVMDTAEALKVVGLTARQQGVSIEEFVATMQGLARGELVGSEAGTKFRNVLINIASESMIPKNTVEALKAAGVNMGIVTDKSLSLTDRMRELSKVAGSDLIMQMFGVNAGAAEVIFEQIDQIDAWKEEITDTTAAVDAAEIQMNTYAVTMDKISQRFNNFKADVFQAIEPIAPFISLTGDAVGGIADMGVAVWSLSILFKKDLYVGIWSGIKAVGSWISISNIAKVATTAWTSVQWALNAAFVASPIGWIVLGIGALVGVVVLCWNKFEGFRATLYGMWEAIKGFGNILKEFVIDRIKGLLSGIGAIGQALVKLFKGDFSGAWQSAKEGVGGIVGVDAYKNAYNNAKGLGVAFQDGYADGIASFRIDKEKKEANKNNSNSTVDYPSVGAKTIIDGQPPAIVKPPNTTTTGSSGKNTISGTGGGSGGGKSVTMNVTLNNYINGVKNPDEFTEQVVRKINDRLNDALAAVG